MVKKSGAGPSRSTKPDLARIVAVAAVVAVVVAAATAAAAVAATAVAAAVDTAVVVVDTVVAEADTATKRPEPRQTSQQRRAGIGETLFLFSPPTL